MPDIAPNPHQGRSFMPTLRQKGQHDPLLQLMLAGILLFGIDALLRAPSPDEIIVPAALSQSERAAWIDQQIMLREARKLGLDRGDSIVERQLEQKMRLRIEASADQREPTDAELQNWLKQHPERYTPPARLSLQHRLFRRSEYGASAESAAATALQNLREGIDQSVELETLVETLGEISASDLGRRFGREFSDRVLGLDDGWQGPLRSGLGWHIVRIQAHISPLPPDFESLRPRLRVDWREQARDQALRNTLQQLRGQYRVRIESTP